MEHQQLVHDVRERGGHSKVQVLLDSERSDQVDLQALRRLARRLQQLDNPASSSGDGGLSVERGRPLRGTYAFSGLEDPLGIGKRMRGGVAPSDDTLSGPGRYQVVRDNVDVKDVVVGNGQARQRYLVCRNPSRPPRDHQQHEQVLSELRTHLEFSRRSGGEAVTQSSHRRPQERLGARRSSHIRQQCRPSGARRAFNP